MPTVTAAHAEAILDGLTALAYIPEAIRAVYPTAESAGVFEGLAERVRAAVPATEELPPGASFELPDERLKAAHAALSEGATLLRERYAHLNRAYRKLTGRDLAKPAIVGRLGKQAAQSMRDMPLIAPGVAGANTANVAGVLRTAWPYVKAGLAAAAVYLGIKAVDEAGKVIEKGGQVVRASLPMGLLLFLLLLLSGKKRRD